MHTSCGDNVRKMVKFHCLRDNYVQTWFQLRISKINLALKYGELILSNVLSRVRFSHGTHLVNYLNNPSLNLVNSSTNPSLNPQTVIHSDTELLPQTKLQWVLMKLPTPHKKEWTETIAFSPKTDMLLRTSTKSRWFKKTN